MRELLDRTRPLLERVRLEAGWNSAEVSLADLDNPLFDEGYYLGRAERANKKFGEMWWAKLHGKLLAEVRKGAKGYDKVDGYSYIRRGAEQGESNVFCMGGVLDPWEAENSEYDRLKLNEIVQDMPLTTMLSDDGKTPKTQDERRRYYEERMKKVKRVIVVEGGLLENRLAMEGVGREFLKALGDSEDVAVLIISHSGAENSYKQGADLKKITPEAETVIIRAGIERWLQTQGLNKEQVIALVGHSKGGWFVEQEANTKEYPNAKVVELAMVVMGTELAQEGQYYQWPDWIREIYNKKDDEEHVQAVIIDQHDLMASLLKLSLFVPDMPLRTLAINLIGKWVAGHYTGKDAAYQHEAVAAIVTELLTNRKAIKAQQKSLRQMGAIVEDFAETSDNPRFIMSVKQDTTLAWLFQKLYQQAVLAWHKSMNRKWAMDLIEDKYEEKTGHNPSLEAIRKAAEWLARMENGMEREETDFDKTLRLALQPTA